MEGMEKAMHRKMKPKFIDIRTGRRLDGMRYTRSLSLSRQLEDRWEDINMSLRK
jgi:hypothetical protein